MKHPKVWLIYWGTDWRDRVSIPTRAQITGYVEDGYLSINSEYFAKISQYSNCGIPVWGGDCVNITMPVPSAAILTETQAKAVIVDSFNKGLLPIPNDSDDNMYFLLLPVGKGLSNGSGGAAFGVHDIFRPTFISVPNPTPSTVTYVYDSKFGTSGTGNGQFVDPHDIDFNSSGDCFVCDRERNDIQKFTPAGVYISKFGGPGSSDGLMNVPYSIDVDGSDNLYVADRENNRIQKFNSAGVFQSKITTVNGQALNAPEDITFDPVNGDIYITDTGNNRIVKLTSAHVFILQWGTTGSGNGQFDHPHSINVDSDRNVFISCGNQPYIQKFSPTGTFIKKFGSEGTGQGQTQMFLEHMDIDLADRVHLINNDSRPIINVWDNEGNWITQYGKTTKGSANGQFSEPEHITCDSTGRPYVVDSGNHRIQIFNVVTTGGGPGPDPGPGGPPAEPSKVKGIFSLKRDINIYRIDPCEGTGGSGGGGGGGGRGVFYDAPPDNTKELSDTEAHFFRTRLAAQLNKQASGMYNKVLKQLSVPLKKVGSPAATPTVTAVIWDKNNNVVYTSPTAIDPTTLPTSFDADPVNWEQFDFSANTHVFVLGDRVGVRYFADSSTSDVNYVAGAYEEVSTPGNSTMIQYQSSVWKEFPNRDFACVMYD